MSSAKEKPADNYLEARENELKVSTVKNPDAAIGYNQLANVMLTKGDIDEAIRYFEKAISKDANYVKAYSNLAVVYYHYKGDKNKAVATLTKGIRLNPDNNDELWTLMNKYGTY